jgi:hypothetical protein
MMSGYDPGFLDDGTGGMGYDDGSQYPLPDPGNQTDPYEGGYQDTGIGAGGYQSPGYTSSGGGFDFGALMKALGLGTGSGMSSLIPLLSMLGIGAGGIMNRNATNKGAGLMVQAAKDANDMVAKTIGERSGAYAPYNAMGANAAAALPGLAYKPIAGNFRPLGSGAAMQGGGMTLSNLMRRGR